MYIPKPQIRHIYIQNNVSLFILKAPAQVKAAIFNFWESSWY